MFFRKTIFEEVGGFDPNIFLYYEEMDICTRLQNNGHKVIYHPNIDFYHIHEASTSVSIKTTGAKKVQILYAYLHVLYKNHSLIKFLIIKNTLLLSYFLKSPFRSKARVVFKALLKYNATTAGKLFRS
jgi:GT2 family glycosyltransferase